MNYSKLGDCQSTLTINQVPVSLSVSLCVIRNFFLDIVKYNGFPFVRFFASFFTCFKSVNVKICPSSRAWRECFIRHVQATRLRHGSSSKLAHVQKRIFSKRDSVNNQMTLLCSHQSAHLYRKVSIVWKIVGVVLILKVRTSCSAARIIVAPINKADTCISVKLQANILLIPRASIPPHVANTVHRKK